MATAAKISIAIEAQTATLQKGFAEAKQAINGLSAGMSGSVAAGMAKFHAGLLAVQGALASVRGAISAVRGAMAELDQQAKIAARIGADADQLTALGFAADLAGSSTENFNRSIEKMQNTLGDAREGNATAIKAFNDLGLKVSDLEGMQADQVFAAIAEQIQLLGDDTQATRIAMDIFGRSGGELLPLLKDGAEGLNEMGEQAQRMGLLFGDSRGDVEAANDAIDAMKRAWGAFVQQVAVLVAPALKSIADLLTSIIGAFNRLMGRATGATGVFKSYESSAKKAAIEVEKSVKATEKSAAMAAEKIKKSWEEIPKPQELATPGIGAVTRASSAGFSAVQEARRKAADDRRYQQKVLDYFARVEAAVKRERIQVQTVNI
jgi:hypothetical protein